MPEIEPSGATSGKHPIQFFHQRSERYRFMVDEGIIDDLETSGLCWLATTDMALSAFLRNPEVRLDVIRNIAAAMNMAGRLDQYGRLDMSGNGEFAAAINKANRDASLPVKAWTDEYDDLEESLLASVANGVALLSVGDESWEHVYVVDDSFFCPEKKERSVRIWDPLMGDANQGATIVSLHQLNGWLENADLSFIPPLVTFSKTRWETQLPLLPQHSIVFHPEHLALQAA
ncbi:MAG: hypothetical protein Q8Q49_01365 [bacterium]|nr:hypothetical protein [bacterium]